MEWFRWEPSTAGKQIIYWLHGWVWPLYTNWKIWTQLDTTGDKIKGPDQIQVIPEVQTVHPGHEIFFSLSCMDTPFHLSQQTPIAQTFLLPWDYLEQAPLNPIIMWVQTVGSNKPIMECGLFCEGEKIHHQGMMHTGADITIIACSEWRSNWEMQPVEGISGIGEVVVSMRNKWK